MFIVLREADSGTRYVFAELLGILNKYKFDSTTEKAIFTSIILTTVAGNPYVIDYIVIDSLSNTVDASLLTAARPMADSMKGG